MSLASILGVSSATPEQRLAAGVIHRAVEDAKGLGILGRDQRHDRAEFIERNKRDARAFLLSARSTLWFEMFMSTEHDIEQVKGLLLAEIDEYLAGEGERQETDD